MDGINKKIESTQLPPLAASESEIFQKEDGGILELAGDSGKELKLARRRRERSEKGGRNGNLAPFFRVACGVGLSGPAPSPHCSRDV